MALTRKIRQIKEKLKLKMKARKPESPEMAETSEMPADTTDFVWVGGFQSKPPATTPEKTVKRKLSFTQDQTEPEEEEELPLPLSPATIELQMAWYKNFKIRFFEDEVATASPAKRSRRFSREKSEHITSTPVVPQSYNTIQRELNTFKAFFEPGPDFKIYDDYHYPTFTSPAGVSYRNLLPGNTPAPPLPPRNAGWLPLPPVPRAFKQRDLSPPPPPPAAAALIFRSYRPADLSAAKKTLRFELNFNDRNFGLTKAFSSECLNYSLLL